MSRLIEKPERITYGCMKHVMVYSLIIPNLYPKHKASLLGLITWLIIRIICARLALVTLWRRDFSGLQAKVERLGRKKER